MIVLRVLVLVVGIVALSLPAAARIDQGEFERQIALPSPVQVAVQGALDAATDSGDPIEAIALNGVRDLYASRGDQLLWLGERKPTEQTAELRRVMDQAASYGLDPASYPTPSLVPTYADEPARLAEADVEFSRAVARFLTHISSGRIEPTVVSKLITLKPERIDLAAALATLSTSGAVAEDIARFEPPHPEYGTLKVALSKLRAEADDPARIVVPEGDLLKPGMSDERVPTLRARLKVTASAEADPNIYDDGLVAAVEAVQSEAGLNADGIVGPRTLVVLNGRSREEDIAAIIANLERWRWMPRDLGAFHVIVNVPEFMVRVVDKGAVTYETRVVVGKPTQPTPTFSHVIDHVIVNPYWNVPASIVANEMMPEVRGNPGYFQRGGYEVFGLINGRYRKINPYWVNWYAVSPRLIQVRQVPGDFNALGRIKFMFPNQHSVYLHDTPSKKLFQKDYRALSHGCVRVENPFDFADAILPVAAPDWNSSRLKDLFGPKERRVNLDTPVPVHLAYFTASVGAAGELRFFEDIYGYDAKMTVSEGY